MTTPPEPPLAFIGCDVGKSHIVVFDSREVGTTTLANEPNSLAAFAARLDTSCLVVCEATGGYELGLLTALAEAGRAEAHRADARKVHAFIRSFGTLGKADTIDARGLSRYGAERHAELARWKPCDEHRDRLHALVMTRRDLVADRTAWANRLAAPNAAAAQTHMRAVLTALDAQIVAIDTEIAEVSECDARLRRAHDILCAVRGVGAKTASCLLALMPELGRLSRRQAAALAGVAPHPRQSGASDAYRSTRGGRPEIKRTLFMAALAAARHNPQLHRFHQRLIARGKKPIVAIVAVMRKLIVICNARLRDAALA